MLLNVLLFFQHRNHLLLLKMIATDLTVKASPRRYLVMLTFFFLTITNAYQYGQYSSISYKMGYLYGKSQVVSYYISIYQCNHVLRLQ